jgi:hypothetical protein
MKQILLSIAIICILFSCKEKTSYQLQVKLKNETDIDLAVSVFPKAMYLHGTTLYRLTDFGGSYVETTFDLKQDEEHGLYITSDLNKNPYDLITEIFDSIKVQSLNGDEIEMKFSPDKVIGYTENLYATTSRWNFEIRNFNLQTMFKQNPVESHDYIFVLVNENID